MITLLLAATLSVTTEHDVLMARAVDHASSRENVITVDTSKALYPTSPDLWGIFFEDIDLSLDGGVYAELVRNRSFEDGNGSDRELTLEYWNPVGNAECFLSTKPDAHPNDRHCVTVRGRSGAGIANEGYFGMGIRKGMSYNLSFALKCVGVKAVDVALEAYSKPPLATARIEGVSGASEWQTFTVTLVANDDDPQARLVFRFVPNRQGGREGMEAQLDHVSMFPADAVAGLFRRDLVEKLAALRPSFLRFPGGCWVEGDTMKDAYRWKTTIGDKWNRRTQWNIWKYWSTNGVGFHEYLLLSEALGAKPLFCINVGMSHKETVPMDKMGEFVHDALDCIEYANGPVDSEWGAKRAAAGHPEPFGLKYLEIGNENGGKEYEERYALMAKAVREKYPDVQLVFDNWKETKRVDGPKELRDDHFYTTPDRMMGDLAHEYDEQKGDFGIFVGEYAVTKGTHRYGSLRGAIGEAAFMMGLERNQNQVKLAAYAPLFANAQHTVWTPNLIYPTTLGSFVNPSWTVQKLFSENRGAEVLGVQFETEYFETRTNEPWTKGDRVNRIAKVQASALRAADGGIILKLANCTEEPQAIRVEGVKGKAVKTLFGGGDAMAHNSPAEPEALKESVCEVDFDGTDTLPPLSLTIYRFFPSACPVAEEAYLFSYFKGEKDGLHLAYSYDGLKWTALNGDKPLLVPEIGKDKLLRDPSICQGPDGTFHMVWTSSWKDRIIGYASSKDLVHWSEQRAIPVMADEPTARNTWAPEVTYSPEEGLFYIYWATTIPGRHAPIPDMDKKEGGLNHRIYLTTTKDFVTFSKTRLWFDPGFSAIDSAIVYDKKNGDWIMAVKNENHTPTEKNIRLTRTKRLADGFPVEVSAPITRSWVEGPSPLFVGDTLYVYVDFYRDGRYGAVRSKDRGKTWQEVPKEEMSFPKGIRHGTAFAVKKSVVDTLVASLDTGLFSRSMDGSNPIVKTRFTADPAGYVDGEWLYVFMGHDDATAKGYKMYDWSVVRTKDMKNWEDFGAVMSVRETFPWARPDKAWASQAIKRNGKWYWYVAISDKGGAGRQGGDCIGVAVADDVKGPWKDPLGKGLAYGRGFIDPSVFVDDDGKAWLFWGNCGGDPGCWYAELGDDMVSLKGEIRPVPGLMDESAFGKPLKKKHGAGAYKPIDTNFEEAPWIYKLGDTYYLEYAAGGVPENWSYSWSKSIHGPWHFGGKVMDNAGGTGTIHGGSVFFKGEWYMLYHDGHLPGGADCRRSACIERYRRNPDGTIPFIHPARVK